MTLIPCVVCSHNQSNIVRLCKQAERRQRACLSVKKQLEGIENAKAEIASCTKQGHLGMENGRDASRARHAAYRESKA